MRRKLLRLGLIVMTILWVACALPLVSHAQDYSFSVDRELVDVYIESNGTVTLEYALTFTCDWYADSVDVIDLGLPTGQFSIGSIRASVGDRPVARIDSDYQGGGDHGVAVWLGGASISSGQTGTVYVTVSNLGGMLYEDTEDDDYASVQFIPVWFDDDFVQGTTDLTVRFHLPPGVGSEEPRWHGSPPGWPEEQPQPSLDRSGRVMYTWHDASASNSEGTRSRYRFGASFPSQYVPAELIQQAPSALTTFFRGLGGLISSIFCNPVLMVFLVIVGIIVFSVRTQARRRMAYLPPSMKVEGVGIKRGLTAVEAAIVLETPLNRVLTMVLFGLLKKGAVTVMEDDPLRIQKNEPLPELRPYEAEFLDAARDNGTFNEKNLRDVMISLVKSVNNKMKGFSRKETVEYYQDIVRRAWAQVEGAETPEVRGELFGEGLEWTMLDERFEERTRRTFSDGPVYVPIWWGHYRPWAGRAPASVPSGTPGGRTTIPAADFAARMVRGVSDTAGRIVGSVTGFTSGVTQITNPVPVSSSSGGSRGSSGGGCACACACACAGCACACAGGGR